MKVYYRMTVLALCVGFLAFSTHSWAEDSAAKQKKWIEKRVEHMQKELELSAAQTAQVQAILEQSMPQMKADREKMHAALQAQREGFRSEMEKTRIANEAKILAVLTPAQRTTAEKYFNEKAAKMKKRQEEESKEHEEHKKD